MAFCFGAGSTASGEEEDQTSRFERNIVHVAFFLIAVEVVAGALELPPSVSFREIVRVGEPMMHHSSVKLWARVDMVCKVLERRSSHRVVGLHGLCHSRGDWGSWFYRHATLETGD